MKKYKELPAFETNKFKAGDYIRMYKDEGTMEGEVEGLEGNDVITSTAYTHFKACRKLEEIKPREFFVFLSDDGEPLAISSETHSGIGFPVGARIIIVRQVTEENHEDNFITNRG